PGIQSQAGQQAGGEAGAEQGFLAIGRERLALEVSGQSPLGEPKDGHHGEGDRGQDHARQALTRRAVESEIRYRDVAYIGSQQKEGKAHEPGGACFRLLLGQALLPESPEQGDTRGYLHDAVKPEPFKRNTPCRRPGCDCYDRLDDIPTYGEVLKADGAPRQSALPCQLATPQIDRSQSYCPAFATALFPSHVPFSVSEDQEPVSCPFFSLPVRV